IEDPALYQRRSSDVRRLVAEHFGFDAFASKLMAEVERVRPNATPQTRPVTDLNVALKISVEDRGTGAPLGSRVDEHLELTHLPVRPPADATQMNEIDLVVTGSDTTVTSWVEHELLDGPEDILLEATSLLTAPPSVACVVQRDGRRVRMLVRSGREPSVTTGLCRLASPVQGWDAWALSDRCGTFAT